MNRVPRTGAGRVPQRHAVVMLRGRDHVRGAGFGEQPRPGRRVELRRSPLVEEVVVGCVVVDVVVVLRGGAAGDPDRVEIPLGVRVVLEPLALRYRTERTTRFGPGRDRVRSPMNEDPQLGCRQPTRRRAPQVVPDPVINCGRHRSPPLLVDFLGPDICKSSHLSCVFRGLRVRPGCSSRVLGIGSRPRGRRRGRWRRHGLSRHRVTRARRRSPRARAGSGPGLPGW